MNRFKNKTMRAKCAAALAAALFVALPSATGETVYDLTAKGSTATVGDATFATTDTQPTGTGVIQSFVRIGSNQDLVQGYNTDGTPQLDTKGGAFTHSVLLSSLQLQADGTYRFLLDINQIGTDHRYNLNEVQLWVSTDPSLINYQSVFTSGSTNGTDNLGFGTSAAKVYDLDTGTNSGILLNYELNHGSGSGDMFMNVNASVFDGLDSNKTWYVYLFSAFGNPNPNNDGFEEWAALLGPENPPMPFVPEPATMALALSGLVGFGLMRLRRLRRAVA